MSDVPTRSTAARIGKMTSQMKLNWDAVFNFALSLPGTEPSTHYGTPTVKANGHALISPGREPGSFLLHIKAETKMLLLETDPATYWESPHYRGWPSVLVRYNGPDPNRVMEMIEAARDWATSRKPPRKRAKR
jgi:hypothetical protein